MAVEGPKVVAAAQAPHGATWRDMGMDWGYSEPSLGILGWDIIMGYSTNDDIITDIHIISGFFLGISVIMGMLFMGDIQLMMI